MTEVSIDLSKQKLFGWEFAKAGERIGAMVRALESGQSLPPVYAFELEGEYYLDNRIIIDWEFPTTDGGHHRAIAHMLAELPLRAILLDAPPEGLTYEAVAVPDIQIVPASEVGRIEDECITRRTEEVMSERWEAHG